MAGELVPGGKQNRIVRRDALIPPRSGEIRLPVYCGEQDRWTEDPRPFASAAYLSPRGLREQVQSGEAQDQVWAGIRERTAQLGADSPTRDAEVMYKSGRGPAAVAEYRGVFDQIWKTPQTAGVVVAYGSRIIGADLFSSPRTFAELRRKILDSYALDAFDKGYDRATHLPSPGDAERYLERVARAEFWRETSPGVGYELRFSAGDARGGGLVFDSDAVHVAAFSRTTDPPLRPLPERRLED